MKADGNLSYTSYFSIGRGQSWEDLAYLSLLVDAAPRALRLPSQRLYI